MAQLGMPLVFTANGAAFASAVMIFPLMLRIIKQAIFAINPDLEFMAKSLGAKPIYATTSRDVVEVREGDKVIKKSIFKHERFREYE